MTQRVRRFPADLCRKDLWWVMIQRWTDANPDRQFRLQPFGGHLADFREVAGYRLPFRVEGGNFFGADEYFPFYKAEVEAIRVLVNAAAR
jgi:hypothetical protein